MDISLKFDNIRFNYRVCAVIINDNKLLCMRSENVPYYYLPGGRVRLHEAVENAVLRELREELDIEATIIRPLWLCQSFFCEDVSKEQFHEICVYFLVDVSNTALLSKGNQFIALEEDKKQFFKWIDISNVKNEYLYPLFLKEKILNLPESFEMLTEIQ